MKRCLTVVLILTLLGNLNLSAQIFTHGADPGHLKWWTLETPHYKLLFPDGLDSLARSYGYQLEQLREATGRSIGMTPGALQWVKHTPVVLHPYNGHSNGSMMYAPVRMDLFTRMDPYGGDPSPWDLSLAAHEPRHLAQLQAGYRLLKPLGWLLGELWPSAVWSLYPSQALSEGDAVAVETALTPGCRTRTADFLNYFRVAFDEGDYRNWYRWRYGSFKHYTPDYYKVGYMTVAGVRVFHDDPLFMKEYFDHVVRHPFSIGNMQKITRRATGKSFKDSFDGIMDQFHTMWKEEAAARAPFMEREQLTPRTAFPLEFGGGDITPDGMYLIREGYVHSRELVLMDKEGKVRRIRPFAESTSGLQYDPCKDRLYWSETVGDVRWDLCHTSRIHYLVRGSTRIHTLNREGRLYNPAPSSDGTRVVVVDYPYTGGSAVVVLSAETGAVEARYPAPDGFQATEAAWLGDQLYAAAVTPQGYGLYALPGWETALAPAIRKIDELTSGDTRLTFVSDRTGVNEYHAWRPGCLEQLSSNPHGGADFLPWGDSLYFCSRTTNGMKVFRSPLSALTPKQVDPADVHTWKVEEALRAQEEALGPLRDPAAQPVTAAPKRYRRILHPGRIHSWAPLYFNYDAVSSMSMDLSYSTASPGVTALFQNELGTSAGFLGYSAHPDPDTQKPWRHSLHGKWTYTGLYPVIEASIDWNDQARSLYNLKYLSYGSLAMAQATRRRSSEALFNGNLSIWVPLRLSRGGIVAGLIPKVSWSFSNNLFDTRVVHLKAGSGFETFAGLPSLQSVEDGKTVQMQMLSASVRGYAMLSKGESQTYPRWGIGAEAGVGLRPGMTRFFTPNLYGYVYGYLPGIVREQGLRLTGMIQQQLDKGWFQELFVSTLPRGFASSVKSAFAVNPTQWKLTVDYAVPIYFGDISFMSPVLYIKNFLLVPHFDMSGGAKVELMSAGAALTAELANILWVPFDSSVGVRASWLGGPLYDQLRAMPGSDLKPWAVEMVFSVDI